MLDPYPTAADGKDNQPHQNKKGNNDASHDSGSCVSKIDVALSAPIFGVALLAGKWYIYKVFHPQFEQIHFHFNVLLKSAHDRELVDIDGAAPGLAEEFVANGEGQGGVADLWACAVWYILGFVSE